MRLACSKSVFTDQALTTERVVIPLLLINVLSPPVVFRKEINSFKYLMSFHLWRPPRANKAVAVLLFLVLLLALRLRVYFVTHYPQPQILSLVHVMFLAYPRYSISWMPYVCIFAAAGIAALVTVVRRTRSKSLALALTALIALTVSTIGAEEQSFLALFGPLTDEGLLVLELCLIVLTCFLLFRHRKKAPNAMIGASSIDRDGEQMGLF